MSTCQVAVYCNRSTLLKQLHLLLLCGFQTSYFRCLEGSISPALVLNGLKLYATLQERLLSCLQQAIQKQLALLGWPPPLAGPAASSPGQEARLVESSRSWQGFGAADQEVLHIAYFLQSERHLALPPGGVHCYVWLCKKAPSFSVNMQRLS